MQASGIAGMLRISLYKSTFRIWQNHYRSAQLNNRCIRMASESLSSSVFFLPLGWANKKPFFNSNFSHSLTNPFYKGCLPHSLANNNLLENLYIGIYTELGNMVSFNVCWVLCILFLWAFIDKHIQDCMSSISPIIWGMCMSQAPCGNN